MRPLADIDAAIDAAANAEDVEFGARELVAASEEILEHWLIAHDRVPTGDTREGFRLLALHRRSAQGDPSFNACRETCREIAYRYNLLATEPDHPETRGRLMLESMVVRHLYLFVTGKLEAANLGEFCCSSRTLRADMD
jgi:hypothetical protein